LASAPAFAEDDPFFSAGGVTAGGIVTNVSNSNRDASKFQEYQDLSNGMLSNFGFTGRNSTSWVDAYGENFGRDDMYINMRGACTTCSRRAATRTGYRTTSCSTG
jgi:hypothetical protein